MNNNTLIDKALKHYQKFSEKYAKDQNNLKHDNHKERDKYINLFFDTFMIEHPDFFMRYYRYEITSRELEKIFEFIEEYEALKFKYIKIFEKIFHDEFNEKEEALIKTMNIKLPDELRSVQES